MKFLIFTSLIMSSVFAYGAKVQSGDRVLVNWEERASFGIVMNVKNQDKVKISFDQNQTDRSGPIAVPQYLLSKEVKCIESLCADENVMVGTDVNSTIGKVIHVFDNAKVVVMPRNGNVSFVIEAYKVSPEVKCINGFCRGDSVIGKIEEKGRVYGNPGKIWKVYQNNRAIVKFEREPETGRNVELSELSR